MALTFVDSAEATSRGAGPTVTLPATVSSGDRLLAILGTNSDAYTQYTPDGWRLLHSTYGNPDVGAAIVAVYYRRATSSDASASYDFPVDPAGAKNVCAVAVYRSDNTNAEIDSYTVNADQAASTSIDLPSVGVDSLPSIVAGFGMRKVGTDGSTEETHDWTAPTEFTLRQVSADYGGGAISVAIADTSPAATGPFDPDPFDTPGFSSSVSVGLSVALFEGEAPNLAQPVFRRWTSSGWNPAP